jgi:hypothetical protein
MTNDQQTADRSFAQPALAIIGMHRSGTSMVAELCESAGLHIGTELVGADKSNPRGHFEDYDFYRYHEKVLSENSRPPQGYEPFDSPLKISDENRRLAQSMINLRRERLIPWGWKDPRTILFIRFWLSILPEARFLLVFRHPGEVACSLERRGEAYFQDGGIQAHRNWYWYNKMALDLIKLHPDRIIVREAREICKKPNQLIQDLNILLETKLKCTNTPCHPDLLQQLRISSLPPPYRDLTNNCESLYKDLQAISRSSQTASKSPFSAPISRWKQRVAIVIPVHRLPLRPHELASLTQMRHHLLCFDRIVISPASLDTSSLGLPTYAFEDHWFESIESYSRLLLDQSFYAAFKNYEFILIHQLDALVFSSNLNDWCDQGFDYIGAPWFHNYSSKPAGGLWATGNGGLSLRKVRTFLELLEKPQIAAAAASTSQPEDVFWSFEAAKLSDEFNIAPPNESVKFAVESGPRYCFSINNNTLPFGCHYWERIDPEFWQCFLVAEAQSFLPKKEYPWIIPGDPNREWMKSLSARIISQAIGKNDTEALAKMLTNDISTDTMNGPPTSEGIINLFDRLLGRAPGEDWFDFWIDKPNAKLSDVRRDLAIGPEFRKRCEHLKQATLAAISHG